MSELIDRKALLAKIDECIKLEGLDTATKYGNETPEQANNSYSTWMKYEIADFVDDIRDEIVNAPTVERPKGKWIFDQEENVLTQTGEFVATYHCSECGKKIKTVESYLSKNHCFCSVCGARMER